MAQSSRRRLGDKKSACGRIPGPEKLARHNRNMISGIQLCFLDSIEPVAPSYIYIYIYVSKIEWKCDPNWIRGVPYPYVLSVSVVCMEAGFYLKGQDYMCIYMYIHIHIYTYIYMYLFNYMFICLHKHMAICISADVSELWAC